MVQLTGPQKASVALSLSLGDASPPPAGGPSGAAQLAAAAVRHVSDHVLPHFGQVAPLLPAPCLRAVASLTARGGPLEQHRSRVGGALRAGVNGTGAGVGRAVSEAIDNPFLTSPPRHELPGAQACDAAWQGVPRGPSRLTPFPGVAVEDIVREVGYAATSSVPVCRMVISLAEAPLDASSIAGIIAMMCQTAYGHGSGVRLGSPGYESANGQGPVGRGPRTDASQQPGPSRWDPDVFRAAVADVLPNLDWSQVAHALDRVSFELQAVPVHVLGAEDLQSQPEDVLIIKPQGGDKGANGKPQGLTTAHAALLLLSLFPPGGPGPSLPLGAAIARGWENVRAQLSLLTGISSSGACWTRAGFERTANQMQWPPTGSNGNNGGGGDPPRPPPPFLSLDLYMALLSLGDRAGRSHDVVVFFQSACPRFADAVLLGAARCGDSGVTRGEVLGAACASLLIGMGDQASNGTVRAHRSLSNLLRMSLGALALALSEAVRHKPGLLPRALAVCAELKCLMPVLDAAPVPFALDLAGAAAHRDMLSFDKWVEGRVEAVGPPFVQASVWFVRDALARPGNGGTGTGGPGLGDARAVPTEQFASLFRRLASPKSNAPRPLLEELRELYSSAMSSHPRLGEHAPEPTPPPEKFPAEVEDETNKHFQRIYRGELPIPEAVTMLEAYKVSSKRHEMDIYRCLVRNLFNEYRFLHKYPDKELRVTAQLFGAIVQRQLVSQGNLGLALKYVLDALSKPPDSPLFRFGAIALGQFTGKLREWPQYTSLIAGIPGLAKSAPELHRVTQDLVETAKMGAAGGATASAIASIAAVKGQQPQAEGLFRPSGIAAGSPHLSIHGGKTQSRIGNNGGNNGGGGAPSSTSSSSSSSNSSSSTSSSSGPSSASSGSQAVSIEQAVAMATGASGGVGGGPGGGAGGAGGVGGGLGGPGGVGAASPMRKLMPAFSSGSEKQPSLMGTSLSLDTLIAAGVRTLGEEPDEATQDRIHFIFNNLSASNLELKAAEMQVVLGAGDRTHPYVAQYIVVKRAAIEPNYHSLYVALLEALGRRRLFDLVIAKSIEAVRALLASDKTQTLASERALLKNLGSWLGSVTIGRNRPLLHRHIDLKSLIYGAYEKKRLIAMIPFVAKVLEACARSKVFRPPNPWLMSMMALLNEIYNTANLKLNLKFEIEVLCKTLNLELNEIRATRMLIDRPGGRAVVDAHAVLNKDRAEGGESSSSQNATVGLALMSLSADKRTGLLRAHDGQLQGVMPGAASAAAASQALPGGGASQAIGGGQPGSQNQQQQQQQQQQQPGSQHQHQQQQQQVSSSQQGGSGAPPMSPTSPGLPDKTPLIPSFATHVQVNPSLALFFNAPQLRRTVPVAVDRAIREIITPVVERSVSIAVTTARELLLKDFAMDGDEQKLRTAAVLVARGLAGSLALVTCREPLRVSIGNHLRGLVGQPGEQRQHVDEAVSVVAADNLDLGCAIIERATTDRAARDVDEAISQAVQVRRSYRDRTGKPFNDHNAVPSNLRSLLPESLRVDGARGLDPRQLKVYADYDRLPRAPLPAGVREAMAAAGVSFETPQLASAPAGAAAAAAASAQQQQQQQGQQQGMSSKDGGGSGGAGAGGVSAGADAGDLLATPQLLSAFARLVAELDAVLPTSPLAQPLSSLPPEHPVLRLLRGAPQLLRRATDPVAASRTLAVRHVLPRLYETPSDHTLAREANLALLRACGDAAGDLAVRDITVAVLGEDAEAGGEDGPASPHPSDPRVTVTHRDALVGLIGLRLLSIPHLDRHVARQIDAGRALYVELAAFLMQACMAQNPLMTHTEFARSVAASVRFIGARRGGPADVVLRLAAEARTVIVARDMQGRVVQSRPCRGEWVRDAEVSPTSPGSQMHLRNTRGAHRKWASVGAGPVPKGNALQQDQARHRDWCYRLIEDWCAGLAAVRDDAAADKDGKDGGKGGDGGKGDAGGKGDTGKDDGKDSASGASSSSSSGKDAAARQKERDQREQQLCQSTLSLVQQSGVLRSEESTLNFLTVLTECTVDAYEHEQDPSSRGQRAESFARLVALVAKTFGEASFASSKSPQQSAKGKPQVFRVALAALGDTLRRDAGVRRARFNPKCYHTVVVHWLSEITLPGPTAEASTMSLMGHVQRFLDAVRPSVVPGFAYAWLSVVAHRQALPRLLSLPHHQGWPMAESLMVTLLRFLEPFLRGPTVQLTDPLRLYYRGTLRVLLVLLHDFPEFLADHHFALCDAIPPTCVQMRNLVLSAFPRSMRLPDPFTQNLKVDRLPEIAVPPRVASDYTLSLERSGLRPGLDAFLVTRQPPTFLRDLPHRLGLGSSTSTSSGSTSASTGSAGSTSSSTSKGSASQQTLPPPGGYDVPLINSLVMYVGTQAIAHIQSKGGKDGKDGSGGKDGKKGGKNNNGGGNGNGSGNGSNGSATSDAGFTPPPLSINANAPMEIFQHLATELCPEGRYLMLNAIANQLRYPNQHCHYFSFAMLYLFAEAGRSGPPGRAELIREQITRVLLERLIVSRPHPWGQLISLLELIRNPRYAFWTHDFTRCAPEIQGVFKSVARSCMLPGPPGGDAGDAGEGQGK